MAHALTALIVADRPDSWAAAGFAVDGGSASIGGVDILFEEGRGGRGVVGLGVGVVDVHDLDGLRLDAHPAEAPAGARPPQPTPPHPNGATVIDHVVLATPDLDRTTAAMAALGWTPRAIREGPDRTYGFFLVPTPGGRTLIEVIQPADPDPTRPTSCWGLTVSVADLDRTCAALGADLVSAPKDAVQPGRRIATFRGRPVGMHTALAFMTPHRAGHRQADGEPPSDA